MNETTKITHRRFKDGDNAPRPWQDVQRERGPLRLVVRRARQSYFYWSFNSSHVFGFHSRASR